MNRDERGQVVNIFLTKKKFPMSIFLTKRVEQLLSRCCLLFVVFSIAVSCTEEEELLAPEKKPEETFVADGVEGHNGNDARQQNFSVGCTDDLAVNYAAGASYDDNSCQYTITSCADCDYIVEPDNWVADNSVLKLPPGAVIGIRGSNRGPVTFRNFHGTASNPYKIINCDGRAIISGDVPGIKLHASSHIRLTGTGSTDDYGILVTNTKPFGVVAELGTTDFEVDHLEITNTKGPGITARTRPVCDGSTNRGTFVQKNTVLHHNYIHDTGGEAMYIGGSNWHTSFPSDDDCPAKILKEPELDGVFIYNNLVVNTGKDGIQVGGAVGGCEIFNNEVYNYGLAGIEIHQSGIQINPGTTGKVFGNLIKGGTGKGIFINGFNNDVYNNLIVDCNKDAIHIGDRNPPAGMSYRIVNNTFSNIKGYGVMMNSSSSVGNIFYNNALINVKDIMYKHNTSMDFDVSHNYEASNTAEAVLVDPSALDYSLDADSPLIDAGKWTPVDIQEDYLLNKRKIGTRYDIGAYEYQY